MSLRRENLVTFLDNVWTAWVWATKPVGDFHHLLYSIATDWWGDAAFTIKFQWSIQETAPDFSVAQSATNMWDYIQVIDLSNWSPINWETWISVATADYYKLLEANINWLKWVNVIVTPITAWEVTVKWCFFSNN